MQSEDQIYFLINHKLTRVYVLYRHAKSLRHVSPQNRFTLKEFETTTREIGLIIFHSLVLVDFYCFCYVSLSFLQGSKFSEEFYGKMFLRSKSHYLKFRGN